jgi:hypothetical protein
MGRKARFTSARTLGPPGQPVAPKMPSQPRTRHASRPSSRKRDRPITGVGVAAWPSMLVSGSILRRLLGTGTSPGHIAPVREASRSG